MKFLVDAQLPPGLCRWLRERGHEAEHVFDIGLGAAPDAEFARRAAETGAVLVSKDEDFVALARAGDMRLVRLRCGNATNRALATWLDERWERVERGLGEGERLVELR
jgi:predicted nuclease of predicted toxin-antitoxin system